MSTIVNTFKRSKFNINKSVDLSSTELSSSVTSKYIFINDVLYCASVYQTDHNQPLFLTLFKFDVEQKTFQLLNKYKYDNMVYQIKDMNFVSSCDSNMLRFIVLFDFGYRYETVIDDRFQILKFTRITVEQFERYDEISNNVLTLFNDVQLFKTVDCVMFNLQLDDKSYYFDSTFLRTIIKNHITKIEERENMEYGYHMTTILDDYTYLVEDDVIILFPYKVPEICRDIDDLDTYEMCIYILHPNVQIIESYSFKLPFICQKDEVLYLKYNNLSLDGLKTGKTTIALIYETYDGYEYWNAYDGLEIFELN
jgi:hypothetical protein